MPTIRESLFQTLQLRVNTFALRNPFTKHHDGISNLTKLRQAQNICCRLYGAQSFFDGSPCTERA